MIKEVIQHVRFVPLRIANKPVPVENINVINPVNPFNNPTIPIIKIILSIVLIKTFFSEKIVEAFLDSIIVIIAAMLPETIIIIIPATNSSCVKNIFSCKAIITPFRVFEIANKTANEKKKLLVLLLPNKTKYSLVLFSFLNNLRIEAATLFPIPGINATIAPPNVPITPSLIMW